MEVVPRCTVHVGVGLHVVLKIQDCRTTSSGLRYKGSLIGVKANFPALTSRALFSTPTNTCLHVRSLHFACAFPPPFAFIRRCAAVDVSLLPQSRGQHRPSSADEHPSSTKPAAEHPWRPSDPTSSSSTDPPSGFPVRPYPSSRSIPTRDATDRILPRAESTHGVNDHCLDPPNELDRKGRDRSVEDVKSRRGYERSGVVDGSGDNGGKRDAGDGVDSVGGNGKSEKRIRNSGRGRGDDLGSGRPRRRRSEHITSSPSPSAGSVVGAKDFDSASSAHRERQSRWQKQQHGSTPTAAVLKDSRRSSYAADGIDIRGGGGARGEWNSATARRIVHSALTATWHGGEHARPQGSNIVGDLRHGNSGRGHGRGGAGGEGSLGNSRDSSTPSMMMATTAGRLLGDRVRPFERSKGASLQRSLEEAMQAR